MMLTYSILYIFGRTIDSKRGGECSDLAYDTYSSVYTFPGVHDDCESFIGSIETIHLKGLVRKGCKGSI